MERNLNQMGHVRTGMVSDSPLILVHARGMDRPEEPVFWERLRSALRADSVELVVVSHNVPAVPMDVPWLQVPNGLDAPVWQETVAIDEAMRVKWPGLRDEDLLDREAAWRPVVAGEAQQRQRVRGLYAARVFYAALLRKVRPALVLVWNGQHAQELVLGGLCEAMGCPVQYTERAFFPGMIQLDPIGILGGSSLARRNELPWQDADEPSRWRQALATLESRYRAGDQTWWEQPASKGVEHVRATLGIPAGAKVVLFAGQVDADAQNLLFSPNFSNGLEAFRWFCSRMPDDVFILGKHHPKSQVPAADYAAVVGARGVWTDAVSLGDALAVADRVAAVNSTVLYEALMHGKPALMLGDALLKGKGIAYETGPADTGAVIEEWLAGRDMTARLECWQAFGAWALAHAFYAMNPALEVLGVNGSEALATTLRAALARRPPCWDCLPDYHPESSSPALASVARRPWRDLWPKWWRRPLAGRVDLRGKEVGSSGGRLFLVTRIAFWREGGAGYRLRGLLRCYAERGIQVSVLYLGAFADGEKDMFRPEAFGICRLIALPGWPLGCQGAIRVGNNWRLPVPHRLDAYRNRAVARLVRSLVRDFKPDWIQAEYIMFAELLSQVPRGIPRLIDTIDVMHQRCRSFRDRGVPHFLDITEREERQTLEAFDVIVAIQPTEASELKRMLPHKTVVTCLPHALHEATADLALDRLGADYNHRVLFVAAANDANVEGLKHFLETVWPGVRADVPDAVLTVCGSIGERFATDAAPGVEWRGRTPDLRLFYAASAVVVNPVELGGGFKIKALEALEHGRPLVASGHVLEGFPEPASAGIVAVDGADAFRRELSGLLLDPVRRLRLSAQGCDYVHRFFTSPTCEAQLVAAMETVRDAGGPQA